MSRIVTVVPRPDTSDQHSLACDLYELLHPYRFYEQHFFGNGISDGDLLYPAVLSRRRPIRPRLPDTRKSSNHFHVTIDVNQFSPGDLSVKVIENCVVVSGHHDERADDHGYVSREFTRRYVLPDDIDPDAVWSSLSNEGILTIEAPFRQPDKDAAVRVVPIASASAIAEQEDPEKLIKYLS